MLEKVLPTIFQGSRYAERIPIGRKEILERATPEGLRAFYRRWYRPDLMAVIAVGDFDPATVLGHIERQFAGLPRSPAAGDRPRYPVPEHTETLVAVGKDHELPGTSVGVLLQAAPAGRSPRRGTTAATWWRPCTTA